MPFPQSFLDELIARNDIVDVVGSYVSLTPKGGSFWGCCPFHNEKTPSFHVLPDKQFYHCFGCKKGGGVINFVMDIENLSYPDAVRFLAKRANIPVPEEASDGTEKLRRRMLELNRDAARWYYQTLQAPEGQAVRDYLDRRQIHRRIAVRFGMGAAPDSWDALLTAMTARGYSKDELIRAGLAVSGKNGHIYDKFRNRLILPVIDVRGDVVGFGSRVLDKSEPKYMNTPETLTYSKRRVLYGLNLAKKTKRPNIILCEGNLDVVTLHQAGFDNAVASMGTALTVEQTRLLSRYTKELVLCYDNDKAGALATQRALELLNRSEFTVRVLRLPNRLVDGEYVKQDADDFIKFQGPEAFERLLSGSANGIEFRLHEIAGKYDLRDDQARVAYAQEVSGVRPGGQKRHPVQNRRLPGGDGPGADRGPGQNRHHHQRPAPGDGYPSGGGRHGAGAADLCPGPGAEKRASPGPGRAGPGGGPDGPGGIGFPGPARQRPDGCAGGPNPVGRQRRLYREARRRFSGPAG